MQSLPTDPNMNQMKQVQNTLLTLQRLTVKAFHAQNLQNLIFIILNDTYQVINYDRSILFRIQPNKTKILGVSGQSNFNVETELAARLNSAVHHLKKMSGPHVLKAEDFSKSTEDWEFIQSSRKSTVYWIPINAGEEELGLWLEKYDDPAAAKNFEAYTPLIKEMLVPAYSVAWEKMSSHSLWHKIKPYLSLKNVGVLSLILFLLLFIIPVRLRIVAPCEVVAKNSFVITAPLEGVIEKVVVEPGEEVKKGQVLYEYDKKIFYHKYQAYQKEVDVLQAELNQNYALGTSHETEAASKLSLQQSKLEKSKVDLEYAKEQLALLIEKSPMDGLVTVDNPDDWRGKPIKVGEKIMTISSPDQTKLKIWIPERDNIIFALDIPVRVFLNTMPTRTFEAKILFISPEVKTMEGELPGFEAEAAWINTDEPPKLGLKGSAVLHGERVSLFYYFFRKPIGFIRKFIGV